MVVVLLLVVEVGDGLFVVLVDEDLQLVVVLCRDVVVGRVWRTL